MMYGTDLRIGEVIFEFVSYNIPSFWLISLNGFDFIFLLRDSEKRSIQDLAYTHTQNINRCLHPEKRKHRLD